MARTRTVLFDELEIEAEVEFEPGCPGDYYTAPTSDNWELTGRYSCNGIDISDAIRQIDVATKGKLTDSFHEQANDE